MKKLISMLLVLTMIAAIAAGCGQTTNNETTAATTTEATTEATTETTEESLPETSEELAPVVEEKPESKGWIGLVIVAGVLAMLCLGGLAFGSKNRKKGKFSRR